MGRGLLAGASVVAVLSGTGGVVGGTSMAAAGPASVEVGHSGEAYGSTAQVGKVVGSGPTALVLVGCSSSNGISRTNSTASVTLDGVDVGAVTSSLSTKKVSGQPATEASTSVASLNIGNGLIEASAITATSQTVAAGTVYSLTGGSQLLDLTIGGDSITANPAPNTRIGVPGVGSVILNRHVRTPAGSDVTGLTVDALVLDVTVANSLGLPLGVHVVIGHAYSGLTAATSGVVSGRGYGSRLSVPGLAKSGPTALAIVPCLGTGGQVLANTTAGIQTPIADTGTVMSTAQGLVTAGGDSATTTDTVQSVSLLPGLLGPAVSVDAVTASASSARSAGTTTLSDAGSNFVNLKVAGFQLPLDVPANTVLDLGIATLYLHRVIETGSQIDVRMIELVLNVPLDGMAAGTDLVIAGATARAS